MANGWAKMKHFQRLSFIAIDESGVEGGQRQDTSTEVAPCTCESKCETATSEDFTLKAALFVCLCC